MNKCVYPENDPENIAYANLFTVKCPFRTLGVTSLRVQKSTMTSRLGWGGDGVHEGPIWPTDYLTYITTEYSNETMIPGITICVNWLEFVFFIKHVQAICTHTRVAATCRCYLYSMSPTLKEKPHLSPFEFALSCHKKNTHKKIVISTLVTF